MKKMILAGLLTAALLVVSSPARAAGWPCCPYKIDAGVKVWFNVNPANGCCPQAGPWYLYWPMEAHFVNPAPVPYPFWPSQMSLPGMQPANGGMPPPAVVPPGQVPPRMEPVPPNNLKPSVYQPVGYFGEAPSYWYGR